MIHEIILSACLISGTFFILVAAMGIVRMPDLYLRMHASTKAGTVGISFLLLAVGIFYNDVSVSSRILGIILFVFITAPVAAHILGKVMIKKGYQFWRNPKKRSMDNSEEDNGFS